MLAAFQSIVLGIGEHFSPLVIYPSNKELLCLISVIYEEPQNTGDREE